MGKKFNGDKLKEFLLRRKLNSLSLLSITIMSVAVTLICILTGFIPNRVYILEIVSVLLVILLGIQFYRTRKSFRTMKDFKGKRKKRRKEES